MKILRLEAENVKRLNAVEITPDAEGNLVIIGGRNAQGKTSVLDSIMYAIGGEKAIPEKPLKRGADKGHVTIDLGDLIVTRTFTPKGGELKVTAKDGSKVAGPQAVLNSLVSKVSFDPLEFSNLEPAKQAEILRNLVGLNYTEIDAKQKSLFDKRTEANREVKRLEGVLSQCKYHPGPGCAELVNTTDVAKEIESETEMTRKYNEVQQQVRGWESHVLRCRGEIQRLQGLLAQAEGELDTANHELQNVQKRFNGMHPGDTTELHQRLLDAETINQKYRDNEKYLKAKADLEDAQTEAEGLTLGIDKLKATKEKMTKEAKFPIEGLGFGDNGVEFDGLPFEQASGAQRLRVSVAIGAALNPKLKVSIVRDGSLLDDDNLALLGELAEEYGLQVWVERVGSHDESAIIIEDGCVLE